jgi:hypothetical protein
MTCSECGQATFWISVTGPSPHSSLEVGINIDEARYAAEGTSKAKRLRYFLKVSAPELRVRTLNALWGSSRLTLNVFSLFPTDCSTSGPYTREVLWSSDPP